MLRGWVAFALYPKNPKVSDDRLGFNVGREAAGSARERLRLKRILYSTQSKTARLESQVSDVDILPLLAHNPPRLLEISALSPKSIDSRPSRLLENSHAKHILIARITRRSLAFY